MCTRMVVRSIHGIELETTQFSGEEEGPIFLDLTQAKEFSARIADEYVNGLPEPQVYIHPTTGAEVLEVWEDHYDSHIFHLNTHGYYDVTELALDD